jgi:hypothetical protein
VGNGRGKADSEELQASHYAQREISVMALQYVRAGHCRELEAQALAKIMSSPSLRLEFERAGAKYEAAMARRKTKAA